MSLWPELSYSLNRKSVMGKRTGNPMIGVDLPESKWDLGKEGLGRNLSKAGVLIVGRWRQMTNSKYYTIVCR